MTLRRVGCNETRQPAQTVVLMVQMLAMLTLLSFEIQGLAWLLLPWSILIT